jgi:hypothetical protein
MEFRNARFNKFGTIDCEINEPDFGWIPFTANPDDIYMIGKEIFEAAKDTAEPYIPPTPEEILAAERASMICTPAQMRLTLHRLGLKDDIQAIADSDPEAGIVWEYATQIYRQSPFIAALENADYTPERIDEIFRAAMEVQV